MSRLFALVLAASLLASASAGQPAPKDARPKDPFAARTDEKIKAKLLADYGGTDAGENAVALGLVWLAKQQKRDGSWEFDGSAKKDDAAATGLAVLAFVGAGETHKVKGKHQKSVQAGINWLIKNAANGKFQTVSNMYGQGIATLALVEAYGATKDKLLLTPAQAGINYIQRAQAANGSWGYQAGTNGDTSIVGWQVQALHAARLTKDIKVDEKVFARALKFLDVVAAGRNKAVYGYNAQTDARAGTALTAIGLWCRQRVDGWDAKHEGITEGVAGLLKRGPATGGQVFDLYFAHYATQVLRDVGGDDWAAWNEGPKDAEGKRSGGLRDALVNHQMQKEGATLGSWDADRGHIGQHCGRVGTTALCILTLEVYYRSLPPKPIVEKKP